ncbi:uncharacterized protein KY384_005400 [Bacidia gigantensis]|uniref:uncharacterized protein n=1 Tax=Bacidia gigantensis TaxID=2732470 RepID=UPI001D049D0A|nr:uncharacterized protein KY384_005400 [Bacidia gigantensis]KAG8529919.1 hypothetical protein KY384_005400 [Bacidia gigantensis]
MNRFRSRKKSHGENSSREGSRRPSFENEIPALPSLSRTFKRKKTPVPEPKPEIDLTAALPATDDFRTSLLMPKLAARFSMLKEQDDPNSMLGKANDDSVLAPKRNSRLDLFNHRNALADIAEVDSVRGSMRRPFAVARTESYGSESHHTDDGGVMSRARPGEGNTMFGGRQKIYKIPVGGAGSVKHFGGQDDHDVPTTANMGGKPIYENDTTLSTFQRLRQQEKEDYERAVLEQAHTRSSKEQDRSGSPPEPRYDRNRETTSSTTSVPSHSRASTAATSVASQKSVYGAQESINAFPLAITQPASSNSERPFIKSRRMYGQGPDRDLYDSSSSSLQRLGSFNRSRTPVGGPASNQLRQSRSATNLGDRYQRGGPFYATNGYRAESPGPSPTPSRMAEFDLGLAEDQRHPHPVDSGYGRSPPLSPPMSPELSSHNADPTLVAALEPNDVGKATASGAFNKPKKQYDEQQYLQRQLQLQRERNTPSPQLGRPFSPATSIVNDLPSASRSRNNSQGSNFSRTNSIRRPWIEDRVPRAVPERGASPALRNHADDSSQSPMERSFLTGMNSPDPSSAPESESEVDANSPVLPNAKFQSFSQPQAPKRDAFFQASKFNAASNNTEEFIDDTASESRSYKSEATVTALQQSDIAKNTITSNIDTDSPTLGPVGVPNGLSSLVRAHLRNDSGQSSNYPDDSVEQGRRVEARDSIFGHGSALNDQDAQKPNYALNSHQDDSVPPPLSLAARNMLEQARSLRDIESAKAKQTLGNNKAQRILGGEAPRGNHDIKASWQEQVRAHHNRGPSTETQKEREELAQELAERRRMVVDKLQPFAETQSRSGSPAPATRTRENSPHKTSHAFGLLKKSSRGSLIGKQEKPSKAMKMLGIENDSTNNQLPNGILKLRDQYPDRAMAPRAKTPFRSGRQQGVPPVMNEALGTGNHSKVYQSNQDCTPRGHSRHSSKSSSAYSESSDKHSIPRNGPMKMPDPEGRSRQNSSNTPTNEHRPQTHGIQESPYGSSAAGQGNIPANMAERSHSATSGRQRSNSKPSASPLEKRMAPPGTPFMINPSSRPVAARNNHSAPSLHESSATTSGQQPPLASPRYSPTRNMVLPGRSRKQSVNKQDISEPTFVSCTSSVDTVDLPPGASLKNGMDTPPSPTSAPPIPTRDVRRKRTHTLRQAFGIADKADAPRSMVSPSNNQATHESHQGECSAFSDDEPTQKVKQQPRKLIRPDTSNIKPRQFGSQTPSPAVSQSPFLQSTSPTSPNHVPFQLQKDVPASAVMF